MSTTVFSSFRWVRLTVAALSLAAGGCTVQVVMPEVPTTHPANPDAESAPLPAPSPLLDSYRPVEPPPEMAPMDHGGMGHDGMNHDGMDQGAMGQEAVDRGEHHHPEPPPPDGTRREAP